MQFLKTTSGEIIAENNVRQISRPFKSGVDLLRKVSTVSGESYYVAESEVQRFVAACEAPAKAAA